jgi:hypothetical protein
VGEDKALIALRQPHPAGRIVEAADDSQMAEERLMPASQGGGGRIA